MSYNVCYVNINVPSVLVIRSSSSNRLSASKLTIFFFKIIRLLVFERISIKMDSSYCSQVIPRNNHDS